MSSGEPNWSNQTIWTSDNLPVMRGMNSASKRTTCAPTHIPESVTVTLPPNDYQPSKAELEEEFDMPGMSEQEIRKAFFRPLRIVRQAPDSE